MCGAVTRERIACGAVGVATPSTRRASTLCHVPRVTEVTCAEAGVPAGTHSVVTPHRSHTGVLRWARRARRATRARTWNVERWATTALSRDPAATRVTAETADLRRSNLRSHHPPAPTWSKHSHLSPSAPISITSLFEHKNIPALSTISRPSPSTHHHHP